MAGPWEEYQKQSGPSASVGPWSDYGGGSDWSASVNVAKKPGVVEDVVKSIPGAVPRAAAGLVGLPSTIMDMAARGAEKVLGNPSGSMSPTFPNVGDLVTRGYDEISKFITGEPVYRPQTGPGRVADMTTQAIVAGPGAIAQKAVMGGAAGLTGEAARLAGVENPIALGVLQMLGATTASLPFILRNVPAANINEAIKNITPQDLAKAQTLMDDAARMGSPITGAEAIAQVTGKNRLQDIQRVVEASREGAPVMERMMNARPNAARGAFEAAADRVTPMPVNQAQTPVKLQQAAEGAITSARKAGNAAAGPYYRAADPQMISTQSFNAAVVNNPMILDAVNKVTRSTKYGVFGEAPQSIRALNAAKQYLDDLNNAAKTAGRNNEARLASSALDDLLPRVDAQVPAYATARGIVAKNQRDVVQPMVNSPTGDIAYKTRGLPAETAMRQQSEILMPQAPRALNPASIHKAVGEIRAQDPTAARDWVRQNIQAIFDESAQNLSGGANQWGGAKFAAQVVGNPRQKANLRALVESVSDRQTWNGFNRMLEVLEAQGKRHAPGSQTAFNQSIQVDLAAGGAGKPLAAISSPSIFKQWYDNFRFGKNTEEMAKILTDPRSVEQMRLLAREFPTSKRAAAIVANILSFQQPASVDQANTPNR